MSTRTLVLVVLLSLFGISAASAQAPAQSQAPTPAQTDPSRLALVIGNAAYTKGPLRSSLNDAGLVAEALRTIGFDVSEGADLNQADFVRSFREFLAKVEAAGPDAIAFVYFSGYGFEYAGENYLVAVDARLDRENDIPLEAVRLSDLLRSLAGAPGRAKIVAIDAARHLPFAIGAANLARGLAAIDPPKGMLVGFSAAPGALADDGAGSYGPYATALAEMLREPGVDLGTAFTRVRERTHQLTKGVQTPWNAGTLDNAPILVPQEAVADAAAPAPPPPPAKRVRRPMRELGADDAYALAVDLDTLPAYTEFVETYPHNPYAPRVWAIIRARREALAWMRAVELDTPQAYWTYLRRYPHGIYAADAARRLELLTAALEPPPDFVPVEFYDVPPPLPDEPVEYVFVYPPAPPPPIILIGPAPIYFVHLRPPPRPRPGFLPVIAVPLPVYRHITPGVRHAVFTPAAPVRSNLLAPTPHRLPPPSSVKLPTAPLGSSTVRPGTAIGVKPPVTTHITPPGTGSKTTPKLTPGTARLAPTVTPKPNHVIKPKTAKPLSTTAKPLVTSPNVRTREKFEHKPPPVVARRPPPAAIKRPISPPPVVHRPPPVVHRPPPVAVHRPPPPVVHRPPPVAAVHRPAPPTVAHAPAPRPVTARKTCKVVNGKQVCK